MNILNKVEKELVYEIALFLVTIASISFLYMESPLLTGLLILAMLIGGKMWYNRNDVYYFVSGALVGSIAEIICIHFGAWRYTNPTIFGIPIWLPLAWGVATVLIIRFAETLLKIDATKK